MMDDVVFVCNHCKAGFSLDEADRRYCDGQPTTVCPSCGSFDIEEGKRCKICREIHFEHDLEYGVCKDCTADAKASYKSCLNYLMPWEREVLELIYGNIDVTEG